MAGSPASRTPPPSADGARKPRRPKRYGETTPRVYTPPLRPLEPRSPETERWTLGYEVIDFAADVLRIELFPWQKWLLVHMLELLDDGSLRFRTVVVLVARQNGKSTLSQVLALWFMIVWGWPLVLGTAQDLETAEEVWQGAVDLVEEDDDLSELLKRVVKVNGKKALELTNGTRYKVKAANRRAGRGFTGDLVMLDELREHQSWDAWGAITKTTMARAEALILALSNAGDASSIVLRYLRKIAHLAVGDPDGLAGIDDPASLLPSQAELEDDDLGADDFEQDEETLGLFEWSALPGCDLRDRDGWAQANPALNHNPGFTERNIAAALTDPEWVFRTEVLCQWSDGSLDGLFPPSTWENHHETGSPTGCLDPESAIPAGGAYVFCVDTAWDRSASHIAVAGFREDGRIHVELVASRAGTDWVKPWVAERKGRPGLRGVTLQWAGAPVSSLLPALQETGVPVIEWQGSDLGRWTGQFYDLVRAAEQLRHRAQPIVDVAAATAVPKPLADAWVVDRKKSPVDASPLVAEIGAVGALLNTKPPARSAYEDADLVVL